VRRHREDVRPPGFALVLYVQCKRRQTVKPLSLHHVTVHEGRSSS